MAICCPKSVNALAIRVTRTDACGIPVAENVANGRILTAGFITLTLAPNIEAGNEITVKKANGEICVTDKQPDQLKWLDATIELCGVPFPLIEMMLGASALMDGPDIVGGVLPSRTAQTTNLPVQIELWSRNKEAESCAGGGAGAYVQWVMPLGKNWQVSGDIAFGADATSLSIVGQIESTAGYQPSVAAEFDAAQITAIQGGGPLAWKCVNALPSPIDDCDYLPIAS
jgi:hypothetical protein